MAHAKHDDVRARYGGRHGYCGVSDEDAGGEFTVDHHTPTIAKLRELHRR
ncbi:MAG TPA: hypothetical protein VMM76_15865 [Pirellulaceae bacterium]|nr:hypothetical protein [Pirellulaceae bacterium]